MADEFPADLKQFIAQHVESLAQLEVLLYLREYVARELHPGEIINRLAITSEMAAAILADLVRRGFAVKLGAKFRYQPASEEIGRMIDLLAETYRDRRLAVTTEIYSRPLDKVKTFADAFRIRKEE
jgi:hypothetical protein